MAWNKGIKDSSRAMQSIPIIEFFAMFGTLIISLYLAHWFVHASLHELNSKLGREAYLVK